MNTRRQRTRPTRLSLSPIRTASAPRPWGLYQRRADLRPVHRTTLAMQAADQLRRRIVLGDVRAGRRLESGRELARQLDVSLPVLREAIAALAYAGMVEIRHGVGVFVTRRGPVGREVKIAKRRARTREIHAVREAVAAACARTAALRRTPYRLQELHLALGERERAVQFGDEDRFVLDDLAFHRAVAQSAGNALSVAIERAAGVATARDLAGRASVLARDQHLGKLHADLVDAIEGRRPEEAARLSARIARIEAEPDEDEAEARD